jgi:hypothetical protein
MSQNFVQEASIQASLEVFSAVARFAGRGDGERDVRLALLRG